MQNLNDNLDIYLILNRHKYSLIYNINLIFIIILLITGYIIFTFKYQSYYITKGAMKDNKLELLVNVEDLKYIKNNSLIIIEDRNYKYKIDHISKELFKDDNYNNYMYIYLRIDNLISIDNYVYEIKLPKENKTLAAYLKKYI